MSSSSKRRITHIGKNEECQPILDIVSGIINEMNSNTYGKNCMSFNQLPPHKTVTKTNSDVSLCGQSKYSNKQAKYVLEKKHPLMEKTQKSLKYLKHNRKVPKQRAHVSTSDGLLNLPLKNKSAGELVKDAPQNRSNKNQRREERNFSFTSNKKKEPKFNLNPSDLIHKTDTLKNTIVSRNSSELNYKNSLTCSDSESEYENFIRNHKVATDESDNFNKTVEHKQKKFKRIQTYSDSEPDCETINKVHKEIISTYESDKDSDKIVKHKRKKKDKNSSKKKSKLDADKKISHSTKKVLKKKKHCNTKLKSTQIQNESTQIQNESTHIQNEPSNINFNGVESSNMEFTLCLNKPGALNHIKRHFGVKECTVRLKRELYLDREVLSEKRLKNNLEQDHSKNNQHNLSDEMQHMMSINKEFDGECPRDFLDHRMSSDAVLEKDNFEKNRSNNLHHTPSNSGETDDECLILENNLAEGTSVNNRSNSIDNALNNPPNNEDSDDECLILEVNLNKDDSVYTSNLDGILSSKFSNNEGIDEDCLILCEVPKFPENSSETCISDSTTMHKESDKYSKTNNSQSDENDHEINIQILSVESLGNNKSSYSTDSEITDKTMLNKNEQLHFINIPSSVPKCNSGDMSRFRSEQFTKSTLKPKHHSKLNKDYFKHAKQYCDPLPHKNKTNKYSKHLSLQCDETLCTNDLENSIHVEKCANIDTITNSYETDNLSNGNFSFKSDIVQSIDKMYLQSILQTAYKITNNHIDDTIWENEKNAVNDNRHISNKDIFLEKLDSTQNKRTMIDVGIQSISQNFDHISPLYNSFEHGEDISLFPSNYIPERKTATEIHIEKPSDELDNQASSHIYELSEMQKIDLIPLFKLYANERNRYNKMMEIKIDSSGIKMLKEKQIKKIQNLETAIHNIIIHDPCFYEVLKKALR